MKKNDTATDIFARFSTTYFYSSMFFPEKIRKDITCLYAYVRTADNFVDKTPQDSVGFFDFRDKTEKAIAGIESNNSIIDNFVLLGKKYNFDNRWTGAFLKAMGQDLTVKNYLDHLALQQYMHGSAEVVGLMIGRILELPEDAVQAAMLQGRAMQFINFIRDIAEDLEFGRIYIPEEDRIKFGVKNFPPDSANEVESFNRLIRYEIELYRNMQGEAAKGYRYIPWRYRVAVRTAAEMYQWTADKIYKDPTLVFRRKVKPSKARVVGFGLINLIRIFPHIWKNARFFYY